MTMDSNKNNKKPSIPQDKNNPEWWKAMGEMDNENSDNDDEKNK